MQKDPEETHISGIRLLIPEHPLTLSTPYAARGPGDPVLLLREGSDCGEGGGEAAQRSAARGGLAEGLGWACERAQQGWRSAGHTGQRVGGRRV